MKKYLLIIPFLLLLISGFCQNWRHLPFQGKLYENGQPFSGQKTFSFSINDGGVNWSEIHNNILVNQGLYSLTLGEITPLPDNLFKSQGMHSLAIFVEGNPLDEVMIYAPVENDPTVQENVKDGISWSEVENIPPGIDMDATNELQILNISNDTLFISEGNFVILPGQESYSLPFMVGTSDTINQPIAAAIGGSTSYIGNSVWQSFLSSVNGKITSIQTVFNNISNGAITLKIYNGEGVGTQFIASFSFPSGDYPPLVTPVLQTFELDGPVDILPGQKYTFEITGNGNLEFITSGTSNPYSFGQSSLGPNIDLQFVVNAELINEFSLVVSQTGNLAVPNGRITDKTGYLMPVGAILPFAGPKDNVPQGFFLCDGVCLDKNVYPDLYAAIGDYWGLCTDQTKFRLPDLRAAFLRGVSHESDKDPDKNSRIDIVSGAISGNIVGSYQENEAKTHNHEVGRVSLGSFGQLEGISPFWDLAFPGGFFGTKFKLGTAIPPVSNSSPISTNTVGGSESRPYNAYVNYIIKY